MTIWMIGFMFAAGYSGWLKAKLPWWQSFGVLLLIFALWPLYLGMDLGGWLDDDEADGKGDDQQ